MIFGTASGADVKTCPFCAEEIKEQAQLCKHCGSWLADSPNITPFGPKSSIRNRRLLRSTHSRMLAGVCGGWGDYLGIDPTLVRIGYTLMTIFTAFFPGIIAYLVMAILVPADNDRSWS